MCMFYYIKKVISFLNDEQKFTNYLKGKQFSTHSIIFIFILGGLGKLVRALCEQEAIILTFLINWLHRTQVATT